MYHPKTDAYHFRYGDYQGKKTGGWDRELHGADPHQARRSASLPREPDLRPITDGLAALGRLRDFATGSNRTDAATRTT